MKPSLPGCITIPGLFTALVILLLIVGISAARGGVLFNPGALNAQTSGAVSGSVQSHAEITSCKQCHAAPWQAGGMSAKCLNCHSNITLVGKDFHSLLQSDGAQAPCQACHTDHHGAEASLVKADLGDFPHEKTGFALRAHQKLADGAPFTCPDCHIGKYTGFLVSTCTDCHQKIDEVRMSAHIAAIGENCLGCHDGWDSYGKSFDHNQLAFQLQGKHAFVECISCHAGARLIVDLRATPQDCAACHAKVDPHAARFGKDCATCHNLAGWKPARFDHRLASFQLAGKHIFVNCQKCHLDEHYRSTPQDCSSCHDKDDQHGGQLGQDCASCHTSAGWKPAAYDHSKAAFPLDGAHIDVSCTGCHNNILFKGTPQDCFSCHTKDDRHNGQYGTDCGACHNTSVWHDATFDHSLASFQLTGAHVSVACNACHSSGSFKGAPSDCSACHQEPAFHAGLLGAACADCHTTRLWTPASFNGSHNFPIGHGNPDSCRSCHPASLGSYTCYNCHDQNEVSSKHREESIGNFDNCVECHAGGGEGEGGGDD